MNSILAIDPGSSESAFVVMDKNTYAPYNIGKDQNEKVLQGLKIRRINADHLAIEMIASYGMPVGREIFETCVWIGRFIQEWESLGGTYSYVLRKDEKMMICHSPHANDATIRLALADRFAYGTPNGGKGTKSKPVWFYGFKADIWQAYAVGVTFIDQRKE